MQALIELLRRAGRAVAAKIVGDDPDPRYSALDRADDLGRGGAGSEGGRAGAAAPVAEADDGEAGEGRAAAA